MARRLAAPLQTEPVAALAAWSRQLALFSALATLVSIAIVRFGILEPRPAVATFIGALGFAVLAIVAGIFGFASIWRNGTRGLGHIALGTLIAIAVLGYPAYLATKLRKLPAIHDITTDPIDPPKFEVLARLRSVGGANPAAYAGLYSAEQQQKAYPKIEPAISDASPQQAFDAAMAIVTKRKWSVVDVRKPQARVPGHIEAVARTPVMGFRDDVSIRIGGDGEGSRTDIRSSSRYFTHDLGANAARVQSFLDDLTERLDALRPEPAAEAQPKKPQGAKRPAKR